ncbi:hypothetical protein I4U23_022210 [Adineta vaga]|nr:hypothetical protein I4U23_022210 [Adineta vaga]
MLANFLFVFKKKNKFLLFNMDENLSKRSHQAIRYQNETIKIEIINHHGIECIFFDDIRQCYPKVTCLYIDDKQQSFLRDENGHRLEPLCIKACPDETMVAFESKDMNSINNETFNKNIQEIQKSLVLLNNEIQEKFKQTMTLTYELHEYTTPHYFYISQVQNDNQSLRQKFVSSVLHREYKLYFLCDCSDDPLQRHIAPHDGYIIKEPTKFITEYGANIRTTLNIIRTALPIVGRIVDSQIDDVPALISDVTNSLSFYTWINTIDLLEHTLDEVEKTSLTTNTSNEAKIMTQHRHMSLHGASLRELINYLEGVDNKNSLGNLYRKITDDGHVRWVCLEHYDIDYHNQRIFQYIQQIENLGGKYNKETKEVVITNQCMYDKSECYSDIDQSLNRYFKEYKDKYSMLLTYHPKIDCNSGRYLLINNSKFSRIHDGTGSVLMWYLGLLNLAYEFNLTLIHFDWIAEHSYDENNVEREKYWLFYHWQIPYSAYQSCPNDSFVRKNIFSYNLLSNQTFNQGKQIFTIKYDLKNLFSQFLNNLPNKNHGFTFYSHRTLSITSSLMKLGIVMEIRWWLQHRKLYQYPNGVWAGLSIPLNNQNHLLTCPKIDLENSLLIGVHIRQGDIIKRDKQGRIVFNILQRYISTSAYAPLLIFLLKSLPNQIEKRYFITIYSEGYTKDFNDILMELNKILPESSCRISLILNGRTSETFNRLVRDDILIHAYSTFSLASGIFNSRQLKIGPIHNRQRVHGMRNFIGLNLDSNHTKFQLTNEKKHLIQQRISYIWKQKQKQKQTFLPLWLNNYSNDYPQQFMFI